MKHLLIAVFVILAYVGIGQKEYNNYVHYDNSYDKSSYIPKKTIKKKGINKITILNYKGEKLVGSTIKSFDSKGNLLEVKFQDKKGITKNSTKYTYNDSNIVTSIKNYKKGQLKKSYYYEFDNKYLLADYFQKGDKDKRIVNDWKYNGDRCMVESHHYKKNGKIKFTWKYDYHDKCKLSKSVLYNSKNKVVQTWTYECKSEGEILKKKKNETQVCKWDTITNDYLVKVIQSFNEKGEIRKSVSKYTADTLIIEQKFYDKNNILFYYVTYDKSHSRPLEQISYSHKGKELFAWNYKYENGKQVYYNYSKKGKIKSEYKKEYDGDLLIMSSVYYQGKLIMNYKMDFETKYL